MKHDKLSNALDELDPRYIAEAAKPPKKRRLPRWVIPVAAVLALAIGVGAVLHAMNPGTQETQLATSPIQMSNQYLLASPNYPEVVKYPTSEEYNDQAYTEYYNNDRSLHMQPTGYADSLNHYFNQFVPKVMALSEGDNVVCSPLNVYMALAMLAEVTDGQSREQILALLGAESLEDLRTQAGHVWMGHYYNDGLSASLLGSSLWLQEKGSYHQQTADVLANYYYASVFRGDLGSEEMNAQLRQWVNQQTGGLLEEQAGDLSFDPRTVLALATTIRYQVEWLDEFFEKNNTTATFHGKTGDEEAVFMNREMAGHYYWGEHFGAVCINTKDRGDLWLFLPDEGYTPEQIAPEVMAFMSSDPTNYDDPWQNQKYLVIDLALPKFDIASDLDLVGTLQAMGITDVFTPGAADFSPILTEADGGCVNKVEHAARFAVDERGVTAAAYTLIAYCGAGGPPDDRIQFTLDRPFLFIMESPDNLPLFAGTVNHIN